MSRRWDDFRARPAAGEIIVAAVAALVVIVAVLVGETTITRGDALTIDAPVYATGAPVPVEVPANTAPSVQATPATSSPDVVAAGTSADLLEYAEVADEALVTRSAPIPGTTLPVPIRWGTNGSTIAGRCTQWEPVIADLAPPGGWSVERMSRYMHRESGCCPQVWVVEPQNDGSVLEYWRTTQGGDRFDADCNFTHIARHDHRSDAGLLQVNGINYDPARCLNTCLSVWLDTPVTLATLGDPWLNIRSAARLCEFWLNAGSSCYRPWN